MVLCGKAIALTVTITTTVIFFPSRIGKVQCLLRILQLLRGALKAVKPCIYGGP